MLRFLFDENFDHDAVRGIRSKLPDADLVTVQDAGLTSKSDPEILAWAAANSRVIATRDLDTMLRDAYKRVISGEPMPGVFAIPNDVPIATVIDDLVLLIAGSEEGEWESKVEFLPLR